MSDSLRPHESQHARPPCSSPSPGVHSDSCPLSLWCHPTISSSVVPSSSCPQSLPASESFPMSQLFAWGGQSTGVSAFAPFLPKKSQGWSPSEWTSKVMLKILQTRLQQHTNHELPDVQAGFRKGSGARDQLPTSSGSSKKKKSSRKTSISALLTMPKPLTVWITINCRNLWKRWEYQTTWPASWETYMQVRKQQLELDMEQQTGSK